MPRRYEDEPTAEQLCRARGGRNGRTSCLIRCGRDPSKFDVAVIDGDVGKPIPYCPVRPNECTPRAIREGWREEGFLPARSATRRRSSPAEHAEQAEIARLRKAAHKARENRTRQFGLDTFERAFPLTERSEADAYFIEARGLVAVPVSPDLRFAPRVRLRNHESPAVVAALRDSTGSHVATQVILLAPGGRGKAAIDVPKRTFGQMGDAAVRLGPAFRKMVVGEGIETTLAGMQHFGLPGLAALSAHRLAQVGLPPECEEVTFLVDVDASGTGQRASRQAAELRADQDRRARLAFPPDGHADWADYIRAGARR